MYVYINTYVVGLCVYVCLYVCMYVCVSICVFHIPHSLDNSIITIRTDERPQFYILLWF